MGFGAGVDGKPGCTGFLDHFGVFVDRFDSVPAESDFDADGDFWGESIADGFGDFVDSFRAAEDGCPAIVPVDGRGGAAEVDIDAGRSGQDGVLGGDCHAVGVAAEDLDLDGEAGCGFGVGSEFGDVADEDAGG